MNESLKDKITRVRRNTRSADILDICDALEKALAEVIWFRNQPVRPSKDTPLLLEATSIPKSHQNQFLAFKEKLGIEMGRPFDKVAYQREYMRKRRAKAKT